MSLRQPPETPCRYGQTACSAVDLGGCNSVTVLLGGETPFYSHPPIHPLSQTQCCLLMPLLIDRWLLKRGLLQIAGGERDLGRDELCHSSLLAQRPC
jgi:hypothetical protein